MTIQENIEAVQARMATAASNAGYSPEDINLIVVSKRQPVEAVMAAFDAGVRDFGENTAQELGDKAGAMKASGRAARWHFIGRLQRNKVGRVLKDADAIHTLDRPELVDACAKRAPVRGVRVFIQVNIGEEAQKGGIEAGRTLDMARQVGQHPSLRLVGLMAVPPAGVDPEPYFRRLASLQKKLRASPWGQYANQLSMGMSDDFERAIACGATDIRVGTAIFGARHDIGTEP